MINNQLADGLIDIECVCLLGRLVHVQENKRTGEILSDRVG